MRVGRDVRSIKSNRTVQAFDIRLETRKKLSDLLPIQGADRAFRMRNDGNAVERDQEVVFLAVGVSKLGFLEDAEVALVRACGGGAKP